MSSFSERLGYKKPKLELQIEEIDGALRAGLWDALDSTAFINTDSYNDKYSDSFDTLTLRIWHGFFKKPTDTRPTYPDDAKREIRAFFFKSGFPETYDFLEFVAKNMVVSSDFCSFCSRILEREKAVFRFVGNELVQITNQTEIAEIEKAQDQEDGSGVSTHISAAISMYSDRKNPDYRNSIKESISAAGDSKATLGTALAQLEKEGALHGALKNGFSSLYGWTNDAQGIRHAIMGEANLTEADARYMLVSCSAFANYLLSKKAK